ncbi:hypothetical protein EW145_g6983 [Phellinidium pouzarii]|uniref:Uncharacterized protein n=1 Tax=Phellinidium pouzarii TaxID=167371 RepID=A0A4S4KS08_9AGAM|nr:hypothetical protein EW145_g6983 [Phellinidium pouzarii]
MNTHSRSPTAPARFKRPQRLISASPAIQDTNKGTIRPPYLVKDNTSKPFQLLEAHPLSLLCRFHNVKRVSLEEGVPPPFKIDVPILRDALGDPNSLLPTHMLAVYDQDMEPDPSSNSPLLPYTAAIPSGPPSFPATPLMIPVNADLWAQHFSSTLSSSHTPVPSLPISPLIPTINVPRSHSSTSSVASESSYRSDSPSSPSRPHAILSLPVHVMRVPSAKSLPLLLLVALKVLPENSVAPALLPRRVLSEFPASPAILTQQLLLWLYPPKKDRQNSAYSDSSGGRRSIREQGSRSPGSSRARSPRPPPSGHPPPPHSPLLSPTPSSSASDTRRFSSTSASSLGSTTSSYFSSYSQPSPTLSPTAPIEPICALADPETMLDPDLRLLTLVQQNFGMWANALALGVKDASVVRLVELAWTVSAEARRLRFGDPLEGGSGYNDSLRRSRRSRSRTPLPAIRTPSVSSAVRRVDEFGPQNA